MNPPLDAAKLRVVEDYAVHQAGYSPCRSKRGVIIFRVVDDVLHIVARGQNHKPDGFACDGSAACKATCRVEAIHAEQMALLNAGRDARGCDVLHVKAVNGRAVPSGPPSCVQCSKLLLAAEVAGVWLLHADGWQRYEPTEFHRLSLAHAEAAAPRPVGEMPLIEVGDWVRREGSQNGATAVCVLPVDLPHLSSPWVEETIIEVRKADGRVWRRHVAP